MTLRSYLYRNVIHRGKLDDAERYYRDAIAFDPEGPNPYLKPLLKHARETVPFYRDRVPPDADAADLLSVPPLTRAEMRDHGNDLISTQASPTRYKNSSGGSTGQPVELWQDIVFEEWTRATENYFYREFLGFDFFEVPVVVLWGSPTDFRQLRKPFSKRLGFWLSRTVFLNSFRMSPDDMARYVEVINHHKPVLLRCYAGSVYQLARFVRDRNLRVHHPRFIYASAEAMHPEMRELVQQVFGAQVREIYGSREIGFASGECARGKLHTFSFANHVEIVDEQNRPVAEGERGRILCTPLWNYTMPLIRYDLRDMAVRGTPCDCGCRLPTMGNVLGRVLDFFLREDGGTVHGGFFVALMQPRTWIEEFQVLQHAIDDLEVVFVPRGTPVEEEMRAVENGFCDFMGGPCRVRWTVVDETPRTPQGKQLFVRCLIPGR